MTLVELVAVNALGVTLLAAIALAAGRLLRPDARHVLWLLVLAKLLMPPVIALAVLPQWSPGVSEVTSAGLIAPAAVGSAPLAASDRPARLDQVLYGVWIAGTLALFLLAAARALRFRRLLGEAFPAPHALRERVCRLAERLELRRCPPLRLVDARLSPMLWSRLRGCELLLPTELIDRLTPFELDALILHELAHVRRRDHWVRLVEAAAAILFWWHPVVWLARRHLHIAEEQSCDALVLRTLSGPRRSYAEGLLKTLDFLAGRGRDLPALASGAGDARQLEKRLTMIMKKRTPGRMSRTQSGLLAALALAVLLIFPTVARVAEDDASEVRADDVSTDTELRQRLLDLERQTAELRHQLQRLEFEKQSLMRSVDAHGEAQRRLVDAEAAYEKAEQLRQTWEIERQAHFSELTRARDELHARLHELQERTDGDAEARRRVVEELQHKLKQIEAELGGLDGRIY